MRRFLAPCLIALVATPVFAQKDIVDTAVDAGQFKTLAAALQAAGLVDTLKGPGPYTVFAPTDEAFAKLPAGTIDELLKPENKDKLTQILTYHVVSGRVPASEAIKLDGQSPATVQGAGLPVAVRDGKVMVGPATVIATDIEATNGVIHVIDTVLLPPAPAATPSPTTPPATETAPATAFAAPAANWSAPAVNYATPVYATPVMAHPIYAAPTYADHVPARRGWGMFRRGGRNCR